jgi:hypothetical protein
MRKPVASPDRPSTAELTPIGRPRSAAVEAFAAIAAGRRGQGRPIAAFDAQIAAIAASQSAELATRNVGDFLDCGVQVINPWET